MISNNKPRVLGDIRHEDIKVQPSLYFFFIIEKFDEKRWQQLKIIITKYDKYEVWPIEIYLFSLPTTIAVGNDQSIS